MNPDMVDQRSISLYTWLFCMKVLRKTFLYLHFRFELFWRKNNVGQTRFTDFGMLYLVKKIRKGGLVSGLSQFLLHPAAYNNVSPIHNGEICPNDNHHTLFI